MIGVPVIAAPTDEEAEFLASSTYQRVLGILRGDRRCLPAPVVDFLTGLHPQERSAIADFLGAAVIGGPDTLCAGLNALKQATEANEIIVVSDIFDPALRLRSLEITAGVFAE
jgi:alkanesulfonate monooxygenase SsuD/methylene tetrahydromethanopterin reductase-like flavin-dependent oxidoreductase (luciferase family)